ncbi:hypothetical protein LX97_02762 [Nonlabens dokdonensis]|jgi:hypothetical protein|uniref:DUF4440 domain-containing protein n=2 Tax=Nonlabens dokdonensis TaxID=328515 RepID=L7WDU4_NONDD|nr:hypothetical protein [Nonlabens dokdonensis]AGC78432.1 hypothetical protein DDD_3305 [Nonlabens dokdonensis DSW-6]PZX38181.1 hypothetical protein LX97_02762 [Nonlabens dokdonensis]
MFKNTLTFILLLFTFSTISGQNLEELKKTALRDCKITVQSTLNEDFKTLLKYTHPAILEAAGGASVMEEYLKTTFAQMKEGGFKYVKCETQFVSDVVQEQGEYRCYLRVYNEMIMNNKRIKSNSHMLGFYLEDAKKWVFVEAKEMKENGSIINYFPDFKTNLKIPENTMEIVDE